MVAAALRLGCLPLRALTAWTEACASRNRGITGCAFQGPLKGNSNIQVLVQSASIPCLESCALTQTAGAGDAPVVAAHKVCKGDCRWRGPTKRVAQAGRHLVGVRARLANGQHPLLWCGAQQRCQPHSASIRPCPSRDCNSVSSKAALHRLDSIGSGAQPISASMRATTRARRQAAGQGMRLACRHAVLTRSSATVTSARPGDAVMELNRT